jgi:O-antigen biosynthesis protein
MFRRFLSRLRRARDRFAQVEGLEPPLTEMDVIGAYRMFLGRDPESPQAISDKLSLHRGTILQQFLSSREIEESLVLPICSGQMPAASSLSLGAVKAATAWAAEALPLTAASRQALESQANWLAALNLILRDPIMAATFQGVPNLFDQAGFLQHLDALLRRIGPRSLAGALETVDLTRIHGFLLDHFAPAESLTVELWIDGVFSGATLADGYRSDLEERFGGAGRHAFTFENYISFDVAPDRPLRLEVRERESGLPLGVQTVTPRARQDARRLLELSRQLDGARHALEQIDRSLKRMGGNFGHTLDGWDAYWRAFYIRSPLAEAREAEEAAAFQWRPRLEVVIPTLPSQGVELEEMTASLKAQSYREFAHQVLRLPGDDGAEAGAAQTLEGDYTVVLPPGDRLAPNALHAIARALQGDGRPRLLYPDADRLLKRVYGAVLHADPALRPDFDRDLLLQTPYLGRLIVAQTSLLKAILAGGGSLHPDARDDLWLRLVESVQDGDIHHIARILHHEAGSAAAPAPPRAYLDTVRAHLARSHSGAEARIACDLAVPEGSSEQPIQIIWPLGRDRPRAAVIVPTRDRIDLLKPCLESLIGARAQNTVELEILVVDNGSTDPQTLSFLRSLAADERIRALSYDHPFNWSAINNYAARQTSAEVLIFLNNDTVVLTPDWCDELYRQAMRPEIGAVGARMLYADGTIQHAGIILGCDNAVGMHEGAGEPLSDAGYLGRRNLAHRAAALTGACLATRATLFHEFGGFDEVGLSVNANDLDYCVRVRQTGFAALYDPRCTLYHFESKSRGHTLLDESRRLRLEQEMETFERRWGDYGRHDPFFNPHFDRMSLPFTRLGDPRSAEP